ncbi:MAG: M67 family metallopeptidase [Chloroflexi bacterium]|nr:M67 family metallopeptidase [Chloroflexota bacterium]MDA1002630.1 M67 family metallopeptidase [Chloroflexota bacterium]MQC27531.1 M67 family peptidase [Chloroflexota bacterium]
MPQIARALVEELIAHAREELPNECCGMVHGRDGAAVAVHRVTNVAASPYRYEMNPLQMMRLERARDESGETLFAIYHSHVASEARPSPTDVRMAFFPPGEIEREPMFPDTFYILVSLVSEPPSVRAFHVRTGGVVEEEPIAVIEA